MKEKRLAESELYESQFHDKERKSNFRFTAVILALVFLFLGVRLLWVDSFGGVIVDGSSMNQTLKDGDRLLMKYAKKGRAKRGDVIVIYVGDYPECQTVSNGYLIKRLIAIEHDKLYCENGQIYICYAGSETYVPLEEPYAYYGQYQQNYNFGVYEVGEGEIFFLGDNRSHAGSSIDSRYQQKDGSHLTDGLYKEEDIYGIVPTWALENCEKIEKFLF
jgi:signal peptidase I